MKARNRLISASAGSGKTYKLVHHFLSVIHGGLLAPDQDRQPLIMERILAATFTRAAAGEIIDRILRRVAESMLDKKERLSLCAELGLDGLCEDDCGAMLQSLVTRLHRLRVGTLDSFLVRSAQAFSTELGMPGAWSILDDAADYAVCLDAIDQILTEKADDAEQFPIMLDLLISLNQGRWPLQVRDRLVEHLRSAQFALAAGPSSAWEVIAPTPGHLMDGAQMAGLVASLQADAKPFMPMTSKGAPDGRWLDALQATVEKTKTLDWAGVLTGGLIGSLCQTNPKYYNKPLDAALISLLSPLRNHAAATLISQLHQRNLSTRTLLTEFAGEYQRAKAARAGYRFDDFTHMLLEAEVTENLGDFYYRLDGQIDHILLDEFQDTSIPQWKLIKPLVDEILSGQGGGAEGRTFFCVGDVKQTLYGWRNAEPQLLNELKTTWPDLMQDHLLESYRSAPVIIESVNTIFGSLSSNQALVSADGSASYMAQAAAAWAAWFQDHSTVRANAIGFCRLLTCADGDCAADKQIRAIHLAAERAAELHKAHPHADVAILVRRRKFISRALARLRQLGVPAAGEGGSPLADDMAVCTVLSLLHLIDHPSDTAAVFHVGSSPLGRALGFSAGNGRIEILEKTRELRAEILDRGLGATLNRWLGLCASSCDARNFRRFCQLIELAHGFDYDGGDLCPFIETVRGANVEDSDAASVRVMTIHASKGRQFDYVILPDLDGTFINSGPSVLMHRANLLDPADCITTRPSAVQASVHPALAEMDAAWKRRQIVEELCALYVGLTRAKNGMEMIVHPQEANKNGHATFPRSPAGVLRAALAETVAAPQVELWRHPGSIMPTGDGAAAAARKSPDNDLSPLQIRVKPAGPGSRLRPKVTPSSLEGAGHVHLGRALTFSQNFGMDWGTVMHRWLEMIEWLDQPPIDDDALRAAAYQLDIHSSRAKIDSMISPFRAFCAAPAVTALLTRKTYQAGGAAGTGLEVWRERAFAVPIALAGSSGQALLEGRMDRVVVRRDAAGKAIGADVIDYKTDAVDNAAGTAEKAAHYAPQVAAYRQAAAALLGLAPSAVTGKLVFVNVDRVVEV